MKLYRWHPCGDRHTTWLDLGRCIWAHGNVTGDGPYAAASCGGRDVVLYPTVEQARARKRSLDRDGCRPRCYRRHYVILIEGALDNGKPPAAGRATTPAAPPPTKPKPKPVGPVCGQPRTNGQPCGRRAGWGADPGEKHCRDHGGSVTKRLAEKERAVEEALAFAKGLEAGRTRLLDGDAIAEAVLEGRQDCAGSSAEPLAGWPFCRPVPEVAGLPGRSLGLLVALLLYRRLDGEAL